MGQIRNEERYPRLSTVIVVGALWVSVVLVAGACSGAADSPNTIQPTSAGPTDMGRPEEVVMETLSFDDVSGWIVYGDGHELIAVDPRDTSEPGSIITFTGASPIAWSADGSRLLFETPSERRFVLDADGSLTKVRPNTFGSFSPGGELLASVGHDLWAIRSDRRRHRALFRGDDRTSIVAAAWSPDGSQVAFMTSETISTCVGLDSSCSYHLILWIENADGSDGRVLKDLGRTSLPPYRPGVSGFAWSSDGTHFTFAIGEFVRGRYRSTIKTIAADGSPQRRLTPRGLPVKAPVWSPDGSRIAFLCGRAEAVCSVRADGSRFRQLTDPGLFGSPVWSPDGSRLAFVCGRALCIVEADGAYVRGVIDTPTLLSRETALAWHPAR